MTEEIKLRSNRKNLTGQKFGKLTVIKPVKTINDTSRWLCKCECGNEKVVATYRLLSGRVKSCGDCFNTINFYIPEIARLEQENRELKAYKNINEDFKKAWDELNKKYTEVLKLAKENANSNEYCLQELEKKNFALTQESQQKSQTICELEQENKELKTKLSSTKCYLCGEGFLTPEGAELYEEKESYRSALKEINILAKNYCNACDEFKAKTYKNKNDCLYCNYGFIKTKINEVLK